MESEEIKKQTRIIHAISEDLSELEKYDVNAAYQKTEKRIITFERKKWVSNFLYRAAAILIIPLIASTALLSYLQFNQKPVVREETAVYTLTSAPGIITKLTLPDSSNVWLNSGSSLSYPARFTGKERLISLTGEGYFEVKSDKENPFIVSVNENMKVKATGTRFNISAYNDDSVIETVLESGKIDVITGQNSIHAEPGDWLLFDKTSEKIQVSQINTYLKTSWKDGRLIFRNATLEEVIIKLSRRYNVDIVLHKQTTKEYKIRASFTNETITQILNYLKLAAPIEWKFTKTEQKADSSFKQQQIHLWIK